MSFHHGGELAKRRDLTFREFMRDPLAVGSAFPASRFLVERMLAPIDWSRAATIIEYGPGTGIFTRALLARLPRDGRIVAIDTSRSFISHLRATTDDARLVAVTGSARNVRRIMAAQGLGKADCIISGLPFSTVTPGEAARIMDESCAMLAPGGAFLAYQMRKVVLRLLSRRFATVETGFEWRNMPPCHLYWARHPITRSYHQAASLSAGLPS